MGLSEPQFSEALTFNAVKLFDDVGEQASVRKALVAGKLQIIVPMMSSSPRCRYLSFAAKASFMILIRRVLIDRQVGWIGQRAFLVSAALAKTFIELGKGSSALPTLKPAGGKVGGG